MKPFASLQTRVILVILLASVPLLLLAIGTYVRDRAAAIAAVEKDIDILLRTTLLHEAQVVANVQLVLRTMAGDAKMQRLDPADCSSLARHLLTVLPWFANLGAALPDGSLFCSAVPSRQPVNIADRDYFQEVLATRQPAPGAYVLGRVSGQRSIVYSLPLLDAGQQEVRAVLIAATRLDWFEGMLRDAQLPPGWHATVIDATGFVAARFPPGHPIDTLSEAERRLLGNSDRPGIAIRQVAVNGSTHLHGIAPLASTRNQLHLVIGAELADVLQPIEARFRKDLAIALALAFASALLSWIAVRGSVIDGVALLEDAVERFGLGERDVRAGKISSVSEIQLLAYRFDRMADRIVDINRDLENRVAQRTAALEQTNAELSAFTYSVSHDLRAPLRAISGFAAILAERYRASLDASGQHYLDNLNQAAAQMNQLIDDLLEYSRIGRSAVRCDAVALAPLLRDIVMIFRERLGAQGTLEVVEPLAAPLGDAGLIRQVLVNLIDNALKYQPAGQAPVVRIDAVREDGQVAIRVADNGIGIAPEYQEAIFKVFQRLHAEDAYPGSGIGLASAQKAAALMAGTLEVASTPGSGSTFILRLPAAAAGSA